MQTVVQCSIAFPIILAQGGVYHDRSTLVMNNLKLNCSVTHIISVYTVIKIQVLIKYNFAKPLSSQILELLC